MEGNPKEGIYVIAASLCCTSETNTTFQSNYTPIKKKIFLRLFKWKKKKKITAFGSSHSIISAVPMEGPCLFLNRIIKNPGWVSLALTGLIRVTTPTSGPITLAEGMNALIGQLWVTCLPWSQLTGLVALELHWQRVREGAFPQGKVLLPEKWK